MGNEIQKMIYEKMGYDDDISKLVIRVAGLISLKHDFRVKNVLDDEISFIIDDCIENIIWLYEIGLISKEEPEKFMDDDQRSRYCKLKKDLRYLNDLEAVRDYISLEF